MRNNASWNLQNIYVQRFRQTPGVSWVLKLIKRCDLLKQLSLKYWCSKSRLWVRIYGNSTFTNKIWNLQMWFNF